MESDSDTSDTSSTSSSSSSSEGRSLPDEERFEPALILGATVELPQELCENPAIFKEFFSLSTWNCLSEAHKQHLRNFLPSFPENDHQEKEISLRKLFAKETFKFSSPLTDFQKNLHEGNYRPDIAKMREILKKSRRKEQRIEERERCGQLMKEVLLSRHKLLDVAYNSPPGVPLKVDRSPVNPVKPAATPAALRAKKRYFQELSNIVAEVGTAGIVSDDENYPEGPPAQLSRKQKRHLNGIQGGASSPGAEGRVQSTMCHRDSTLDHLVGPGGSAPLSEERYRAMLSVHKKRRLKCDDHPELDIANITLHDISVRTQLASGHRRPIPSRPSSQLNQIESKAKKLSKTIKTEPLLKAIPPAAIYKQPITEISEPKLNHITQNKINVPAYNDYTDSENDSIIDPVENIVNIKPPPPVTKPNAKRRSSANSSKPTKAKLNKTSETSAPVTSLMGVSSPIVHAKGENITISHDTSPIIPQKQLENKVNHSPVKAATLSDLEGINMMQIPIDFDDSNIDILDELNNKTPELMQETHVCFLSLIRDIICSTADHRIRLDVLDKHLTAWQDNPISPLNDWYSVTESWVAVLPSAINFLTGDFADQPEDFVPYLEYKPLLQMYQWIGAGRDTDNLLVPLCQYWLDRRNNMTPVQMSLLPEPDLGILERPQTPPPPRWPTLWKVRKAEPDEVAVFREQERVRYENPHKAFTYRMHGYESIVAPIKGIYNQSTGVAKARGHSMLNADRPNFVTILTLVRDATARLPNGEGTRADICELLRCSQYISSTAPDNLLQSVVSGALDRMHTEYDPCVKYDPKKKIWIYLHRSRTESEFEKIHQQIQAMGKLKKNLNRKTAKPKAVKPKAAPIKAESISLQDTYMENKHELESGAESSAILNKVIVSDKQVKPKDKPPKSSKPVMCRNSITVQQNNVQKPIPIQVSNSVTSGIPYTSILANQNNRSQSPTVKKCSPTLNELSNVTIQTSTNVNNSENVSVAINIAPNTTTKPVVQRQIRTNSPMGTKISQKSIMTAPVLGQKPGKSIVKVTPGKSLINPNLNQLVKQNVEQIKSQTSVQSNLTPKTKIVQQGTFTASQKQQIIQSLIVQQQQKQSIQTLTQQTPKITTAVSSQHIIQPISTITQTISSQQILQSQQKIQLTTTVASTSSPTLTSGVSTQQVLQPIAPTQKSITGSHTIQGATLTPLHQQQILQSIKQQQLKQPQIQQMMMKQQQVAALHQLQKHLNQAGGSVTKCGTSLLGPNAQRTAIKGQTQQPLVAKVVTNASGQVFSLESILSKQANVIPQGVSAIRVGTKQPQSNQLIQLSGGSSNQVQQYAVVSQGNLISVGAPRLASLQTSQVSNAATIQQVPTAITRVAARPVLAGKPNQKIIQQQLTQQIVNAKLLGIQNQQGKIITAQAGKPGLVRANLKPGTGGQTIRMVNTAGLNIATIAGKPVILASKNNQIQGQNVIIQSGGQNDSNTNLVIGGQTLKVPQNLLAQGNVNLINTNLNQQSSSQTTVMLGGQVIKVQSGQSGVSLSQPGVNISQTGLNVNHQQTVMLGGQTLKVQSSTSNSMTLNQQSVVLGQALKVQSGGQVKTQVAHQGQRVVLASQGQGGQLLTQQILLPPGFQGGAINIKTLQGLKVIPIAQQTKGALAGRQQVFARIIPPAPPRPPPPGGE